MYARFLGSRSGVPGKCTRKRVKCPTGLREKGRARCSVFVQAVARARRRHRALRRSEATSAPARRSSRKMRGDFGAGAARRPRARRPARHGRHAHSPEKSLAGDIAPSRAPGGYWFPRAPSPAGASGACVRACRRMFEFTENVRKQPGKSQANAMQADERCTRAEDLVALTSVACVGVLVDAQAARPRETLVALCA
jgi:hypothetical protein